MAMTSSSLKAGSRSQATDRLSPRPVNSSAPIGVFDSGVGGLTVLRSLLVALPQERFLYLGDTARVPYGTKDADTIIRYSMGIAERLRGDGCKALVVACNTASAVALEPIAAECQLPVIGVIDPLAAAVASLQHPGPIVALGTRGTIRSGAYPAAIHRYAPARQTIGLACPLFVPLVEEGWCDGEVVDKVIDHYLSQIPSQLPPSAILLGCTHYPLLRHSIQRWLDSRGWRDTRILESGPPTAAALSSLLSSREILSNEPGETRFWVTDGPAHFRELAARFLGQPVSAVEHVHL